MVFLPEDFNIEESGYQNIIKHELTHIRHHDMLITILAVTALILHWYNPFCYYYLYKLQNLNELYNDEMVAKSMNRSEKTEYCRLMIQFSIQPDSFRQRALTLNLSGTSKKTFERRIDTVMSTKKKSSLLLPIITGMLCICMGTCSAFAYSETCEQDILENSYDFNSDSYFIEEYMEDELLPYDEFFTDEAGNVSPVPSIEPKVSCRHSYKKGTQTIHTKKGKGCVIKGLFGKIRKINDRVFSQKPVYRTSREHSFYNRRFTCPESFVQSHWPWRRFLPGLLPRGTARSHREPFHLPWSF